MESSHLFARLRPHRVGPRRLRHDETGAERDLRSALRRARDGQDRPDKQNIDGFRYKVGWAKIQPDNAATFKWDSIDSAIAIAAANGKKLCISISGGLSVPGWAYTTAPVVYKYTMQETDPNTGLSIGSQPLPWDTAYLDKWRTFLAAFAARYENNPACSYVVMGGFMQSFNMVVAGLESGFNAMENLAKNPPPGYPGLVTSYPDFSAAYIPAAQRVMTDYANSFPTTSLLLTMLRVVPGDLGVTLQNTVSEWGKATFPGQVGTMVSALYAVMPPHIPPPAPLNYPKGFQMVDRATRILPAFIWIPTRCRCRSFRFRSRMRWSTPFRSAENMSRFTKKTSPLRRRRSCWPCSGPSSWPMSAMAPARLPGRRRLRPICASFHSLGIRFYSGGSFRRRISATDGSMLWRWRSRCGNGIVIFASVRDSMSATATSLLIWSH